MVRGIFGHRLAMYYVGWPERRSARYKQTYRADRRHPGTDSIDRVIHEIDEETMKTRNFIIGLGLAGSAAVVAGRRFLPEPIEFNSLEAEDAVDDGSQFIDVWNLKVRTRIGGEGRPALVLLHGFAASVFTWHKVFAPLCEFGTVIAFDRPAFGFTTRPTRTEWHGRNPYSIDSQADLTIELLDHFGIDRAILIGHSSGGTIAALTALKYPERIESLVLMSPAVYMSVPPPPWMRFLINGPMMHVIGPAIARAGARLTNPIMRRAWHDPSLITPEIREGYLRPFKVRNWDKGMWEAARANRETGLNQRVGALRTPTLVVTGDQDHVVPVDQSVRLAGEIPSADLKIVSDCGHIPQEEKPERFLEIVRQFVKNDSNLHSKS